MNEFIDRRVSNRNRSESDRINNSKSEQDGLDPNLIAICLIEE